MSRPNHSIEFEELRLRANLSRAEAAGVLGLSERTIIRYETGQSRASPIALKWLEEHIAKSKLIAPSPVFKFIDLFAGIGGLRIGFDRIGGRCVFTSEWDKYSQQTYRKNFGDDHPIAGDIREYSRDPSQVPQHDVLLAGFPCQPFSIAGVSKKNALGRPHGFLCDTQGTLFFDLKLIIAHHRPAVFVLENVKNLERHDRGRTFSTIMRVLREELGYEVHYRVIDSRPWVPQRRERIFIVGFRDPSRFDFGMLQIPDASPRLGSILESEVDPKYTLTAHLWNYLKDYKEKHQAKGNGFGYSLFGPDDVARTLSARYFKDGSEVLISQGRKRPRRLTPRECARLMGFERSDGSEFIIPVSDTQAYKQFGNAVVVPVVNAVAEVLKPHISEAISMAKRSSHKQPQLSLSLARELAQADG